jgi:ABC-type branched-subunit amino acid transport system permease subunit
MFVLVVVPQPGSWEQLGAQGVPWLASLAAFAAVAMGAYLLLRRSRRSPTGPATTKPRDDEPVRTAA